MTHLIDKAALVAEIKKRIKEAESNCGGYKSYDEHRCNDCTVGFYEEFLEILDTLEVKEVDLEKELENLIEKEKAFVTDNREVKYYNGDSFNHIYELEFIAKHFFELGIKAQKGEII